MSKHITIELITQSAGATFEAGRTVGENLKSGDVVALIGELGSGKTCFVGGLARGLGVGEDYMITSPTFTLVNEYPGRCTLYHLDVYRLNDEGQLQDLGYDEFLDDGGVVVIEWADKIACAVPENAIQVNFEYLDENMRKMTIRGPKEKMQEIKSAIITEVD